MKNNEIEDEELEVEDIEENESEEEIEIKTESSVEKQDAKKPVSNAFTRTIEDYLNKFALNDKYFAECLKNEKKNIIECCSYIVGQVKKMGVQGFEDAEIYQMARHYYLEDIDPKELKESISNGNVVVNHHVELTDEEKEQAKQNALKKYEIDIVAELKRKEEMKQKELDKRAEKEQKALERKVEDLKKKQEESGQLDLFSFGDEV